MNKLIFLALAVISVALAEQSCHGQDWRDPAFQQALPQYYPPNRYPLGDSSDDIPRTSLPSTANPHPKTAFPQPSNAVKSLNGTSKAPQATPLSKKAPSPKPLTKKPVAKRLDAKKSAAIKTDKEKKTKPVKSSPPVITYDIYRDGSRFPIDPRKPCSVCRRSVGNCSCGVAHGQCGPGNHGQPYQEKEPGGFACGKKCSNKRPLFSVYWPRPFSAKRAEGHPHRCNCNQCIKQINDRFDHLIDFKLIDYQRTDNGHCGPEADRFGCLGESKYQGLGMHSF